MAAYEAAAVTAGLGGLPPDPDAVGPELTWTGIDPPAAAAAATRLAHLRAVLRSSRRTLTDLRGAADLAAGLDDAAGAEAVSPECGKAAVLAAGAVLGWQWQPDPWPPVLAACGLTPACIWGRAWTAGELRAVLARAAVVAGREPPAFLAAVAARLAADVRQAAQAIASREREEAALVGEMRAARARAAAAGLLADDRVVDRVARAEGHLQRQLERVLGLLRHQQVRRQELRGGAGANPAVRVGFDLRALPPTGGDGPPRH